MLLAAALIVGLGLIDLALRFSEGRLSGNLAHVAQIPEIIERVSASGDVGATLLVGNSLTNNGVDAEVLGRELSLRFLGKVTPDGSSLWDWNCLLRHQLIEQPERRVARVVLGTAWHLASDQTRADPSRLGALFCKSADILHPSRIGISSPGDVGEFITARVLRLYALRDTLRNRMLAGVVPHYKRFSAEQNAAEKDGPDVSPSTPSPEASYTTLGALARDLKSRGTELVVLAMPVRGHYELDGGLRALAAAGDLRLIDYRDLPGIEPASFVDEMHLGSDGRAVMTARLAQDLARDFPTP